MSATVLVRLPFPPSVNNLFCTVGRRRVPTERYEKWRRHAAQEVQAQRPGRVDGAVTVRIDLVAPDRRRRDCDNHAKAVLDALVTAGIIEDDSAVRRLNIGWENEGSPCLVVVTAA